MRTLLSLCLLLPILLGTHPFPHFNPKTVKTFKGEVASIQTFGYITSPTPHKQILLRTPHKEVTVDLGPEWYLEAQGITVFPGEPIEITGSLIRVNGTYFVIASSITVHDTTYPLRDANGLPSW